MSEKLADHKNLYNSHLTIFCVCFGFYVVTQVEIIGQFYWRVEAGLLRNASELLHLVGSQTQNLGVALAATALFVWCKHGRKARIVYTTWLVFSLLYLALNQVFFAAFFQHIQINPNDVQGLSVVRLMDSLHSRFGGIFYLNLMLGGCLALLLYRQLTPQQQAQHKPAWVRELAAKPRLYSALLLVFLALGFTNARADRAYVQHPFVGLGMSLLRNEHPAPDLAAYDSSWNIDDLRYGQPSLNAESEQPLLAYSQQRRQQQPRPNLIYIILESVGSVNLLEQSQPDPAVTPNLHRLMPHAILFPALYNNLPGSERAHWAIHTGGVAYTWGGDFVQAGYTYSGPTLVGSLKQLGYQTGLFSAAFMDSENFREVYKNLPFEAALIPDDEPVAYNKAHLLNSWGIDEAEVMRRALAWVDSRPAATPFFLLFLNSNTHHPYSVPKAYPKPFTGKDDLTYYRNALHFMDDEIGRLVAYLAEHQLLENTIIAISGDHGESFGQRHPTNFFHGSQLYEENIKNFLLLLDFTQAGGPLISSKRGMIGDIMPTLLHLAGGVSPQLPAQNLFAPTYQERIHYFHTELTPEKWGLLDGQWKFIAYRTGAARPALYDLRQDSTEQNNLAALFPQRSDLYTRLVAHWYVRSNQAFIEQLAN